jgi:hypothetical protein
MRELKHRMSALSASLVFAFRAEFLDEYIAPFDYPFIWFVSHSSHLVAPHFWHSKKMFTPAPIRFTILAIFMVGL